IIDQHPWPDVGTKSRQRQPPRPLLEDVFVARTMTLGVHGPAAEDGAEVEHVVLDPRSAAVRLQHVEAVDAARVVVIEPRTENPRSAQLAPMLVGHDVVRIVGACAVVPEVAQRLAGRKSADEQTGWAGGEGGARLKTTSRSVCFIRRRFPFSGSRIVACSEITSAVRSICTG